MIRLSAISLACLTACASPAVLPAVDSQTAASVWTFDVAAPAIRDASCPAGSSLLEPESIKIDADPVELGGNVTGLTYVGGWHLTSNTPTFGGLSGLEVLPSGDLLAVSDQGDFFQINIDGSTPDGSGTVATMRGADGARLGGKLATDAEGLVYKDGLALVSFERDHRILGFAIEACGARAKGVEIAALPDSQAGRTVNPNRGAEALSLSVAGELTFGYETGRAGSTPLGAVYGDGRARFTADANAPFGFAQVGRDELGGAVAELFRAYDPVRGNRNIIRIGDLSARLARPKTVDNFEGIALQKMGEATRIWIISDDNFNREQRTLLMAFDVAE